MVHSFNDLKVFNTGFRGKFSLLSDDTTLVKMHNTGSDCQNINIGVPQGSINLLLLINDLPNHIDTSNLTRFVDYTSLIVSSQTPELLEACQSFIVSFVSLCKFNSITVNIDKIEIHSIMSVTSYYNSLKYNVCGINLACQLK